MSKQVKLRRGTTAEHATFTGALGEVTVDTTKDVPIVHNGSTAGGFALAREDRPRGWVKTETFATVGSATWTQTGKTDLKRIRVTCYGGGGGGGTNWGAGGGSGGVGIVSLEASAVTTNVTVTVGAGGASGSSGGSSSFGSYIACTGGSTGSSNAQPDGGQSYNGGAGGTASGSGVYILGGAGGSNCWGNSSNGVSFPAYQTWLFGGQGGGLGGGAGQNSSGTAGKGITGGGGGAGNSGASGCVIVEEIYGLY